MPAGEAFPNALVEPWTRGRRQIINTYGPTEASTDTSRQSLRPGEAITIGPPFPNVTYVILDQLRVIEVAPLQLPLPDDPRAQRVAELLLADPSDPRPLTQISRASGASRRTIERLFLDSTGITFGKWRQQLRLMHAMRLLGGGAKVTHAALEAGYSTPSAFIAAFRKALGSTPAQYFKEPTKA